MITDDQIAEATTAATAAEKARAAAEAELAARPHSDVAARKVGEAAREVALTAARLRELCDEQAREKAAEMAAATREELEEAAAKQIAQVERELKAAGEKLETAAVAAQRALVGLMEATDSYTALVVHHAHALDVVGLDLEGGETGGGERFLDTAVRIRGEWHVTADPGAVLAWMAHRVADARLPWLHPARAVLEGLSGHGAWDRRDDELLAGIAEPARVKHPEPPRLVVGGVG